MARRSAAVGARELKTRLGAYLHRVRDGRTLVITDRGEPVAELRPVERHATDTAAHLARLTVKAASPGRIPGLLHGSAPSVYHADTPRPG